MENNIDKKTEFKQKFFNILNKNKLKIYILICTLIVIITATISLNIIREKKNFLIAEKYISAGLYLINDNKEKSKNLYEEIVLSKNKFYSILALNALIEKKLINDNDKILEYFDLTKSLNISQSQKDLIDLKKALYLIKIKNKEKGHSILKNLVDQNSTLSSLAKELFDK